MVVHVEIVNYKRANIRKGKIYANYAKGKLTQIYASFAKEVSTRKFSPRNSCSICKTYLQSFAKG